MHKLSKKDIKVGILGGTFDPPHIGHLHISTIALKKLRLNKLIWAVTKRNPLKKKSYLKLIYNSIINGYFTSLVKMGLKLAVNYEYLKTKKNLKVLFIDPDKLINDLSSFVKEVTEIKEHITVNVNRKHLLIKL